MAAIAMGLQKARTFLISHMPNGFVKSIFLEPFETIEDALKEAVEEAGSDAKIILMPYGGSTLPVIKNEK